MIAFEVYHQCPNLSWERLLSTNECIKYREQVLGALVTFETKNGVYLMDIMK